MCNLIRLNVNSVYAIGDIHGNFKSIPYNIKHYDLHDCVLIFCGDIGFGFEKYEYYEQIFNKIKRELSKRNIYCLFVRGNHDDKEYFNGKTINFKRIKAIPDYTVVQTYDIISDRLTHNILCVGGATSIDRTYRMGINQRNAANYKYYHMCSEDEAERKAPKCYWIGEQPVFDEDKIDSITKSGINIDTVCTHTCPSFCQPLTKDGISYWLRMDEMLERDVDNERQTMDKIYRKLKEDKHSLNNWHYGHFHYTNTENTDNTMFRMLDMERNGNFMLIEIK